MCTCKITIKKNPCSYPFFQLLFVLRPSLCFYFCVIPFFLPLKVLLKSYLFQHRRGFYLKKSKAKSSVEKQTMVDIKSTSNAVWWIKHPKTFKHRTTLCQDMTDLFCNISMHGYNKLLEAELFLYEKFIWFCLHVTNMVIVITVLSYTWEQFVSKNFGLYLHDPLYPIENIPFPGISICSNNRISRQAAESYANELSSRDPRNRSAKYFMKFIPYFSNLYYKFERVDDYDSFNKFQTFLDNFGTNDNETYYNIRRTIKMLTPKCRDLIVKCILNGKEIDCFGENAFQGSITMYGPCCIFNSHDTYRQRNSSFRLITSEMGLKVFINSSHSDDMVSLLNMDAYVVIIHKSNDFPDTSSGNAIEVFPMINEETFIAITSKYLDTSIKLRTLDSSYRQCYFDDESLEPDLLFRETYSFSNCIMRCRVDSISALCNCVPFYMPVRLMEKIGFPYCTLHHVACLQQYNFKWHNVLTKRIKILGLERELEEALYCPQCLPSCDDTLYDISMMSLPTDRLAILDNAGYDFNLKLEDMSVLRVYFGETTALCYKRLISNSWEEAFSTIGNIVSIFLGFCMVAIFEMLFFMTKYLHIAVKTFIANSEHNSNLLRNRKAAKTKVKRLYILP